MESSLAMEDCLKLLSGERDEQRLAGLLLATKLFRGDDSVAIHKIYEAVGVQFIDRLLMTGLGKGSSLSKEGDERVEYLTLSLTVMAAFCRVPEIAASMDMVSKVQILLGIISSSSDQKIIEECYEILLSIATISEEGFTGLYESGAMSVLSSNFSSLPDGSRSMELSMKLLQLILTKLPDNVEMKQHQSNLSQLVPIIARQFAFLHNALKFEALQLLVIIMSSADDEMLRCALGSVKDKVWATYMHVGVIAILQNRVASVEKLRALILVESMMSIVGEMWLLDHARLTLEQNALTVDKCFLLVLESARVETAVLLNELAYLKYGTSEGFSASAGSIIFKEKNLDVLFSLLEKIIKLISIIEDSHTKIGNSINESTLVKVMNGLNETIQLVLDFLHDAKDHGQRKGDDLLASVRIVGRYLAEAPCACKEMTEALLDFILSIQGGDESSPFYSICFMLPFLCQRTMEVDGCNKIASFGGHKIVAGFLTKSISHSQLSSEGDGIVFLACDTTINILMNRERIHAQVDGFDFIQLLQALAFWAGNSEDMSVVTKASCICSLVFDLTSEEAILGHEEFDPSLLQQLSQLLLRSLSACMQNEDGKEQLHLQRIITAGFSRWAGRFPSIRQESKLLNVPM